ncbi:MAG TPA: flagellar basal body-associated FliL family protein [Thermodesulfovibrionales bacterium]|nr:flagellar basal body-associated FliL family protein [Thermodesulfovibrionales bacterium]
MAEEVLDSQAGDLSEVKEKPRKGKMKLFIILAIVIIIGLGSGFAAYTMFLSKKGKAADASHEKAAGAEQKIELFALDPFVMNLAEQNRFLKVSVQFELGDKSYQPLVTEKAPLLRDAIIILVSSKSYTSVMTPEGKLQLKDEILLRANQAVGKDVFKNLYFTEFVTQ